jgi:DNA gyrase subunit B
MLTNAIKSLVRMERILDVFERKNMERLVLKSFAREGIDEGALSSEEKVHQLRDRVYARIQNYYPEICPVHMEIDKDEEESKFCIKVTSHRNGLTRRTLIDYDLTESPSFGEIGSITQRVRAVMEPPFVIEVDNTTNDVLNFSRLVELITDQGRKNLGIQRYKGLGEMNSEQLWETTMNPDHRRILQVAIEDAVKANEIFSTLMGDQVEPRRDFIEKNALNVVNLDY